jgi:REP-associated tyrosine transposase
MPRRLRHAAGGHVYHVLNRAVGRSTLFEKAVDFEAFVRVLTEANERTPMRLLAYCIMSNHWHLVVWPKGEKGSGAIVSGPMVALRDSLGMAR